jgi:hypothetical protein
MASPAPCSRFGWFQYEGHPTHEGISEKMVPAGKLLMPKSELQMSKPDKPEITIFKHHLNLKMGQMNSKLQYPNLKLDQTPIVWDFEFRTL